VNRANRCRPFLDISPVRTADCLSGSSHHDRKKRRRCHRGLAQLAPFKSTTPLEHLVRDHAVCTSHKRSARTWLQCQLRTPPLLRHRSEPASATTGLRFDPMNHDDIVAFKPEVRPEGRSGRLRPRRANIDLSSYVEDNSFGLPTMCSTMPDKGRRPGVCGGCLASTFASLDLYLPVPASPRCSSRRSGAPQTACRQASNLPFNYPQFRHDSWEVVTIRILSQIIYVRSAL
jgi:hypothetical protein